MSSRLQFYFSIVALLSLASCGVFEDHKTRYRELEQSAYAALNKNDYVQAEEFFKRAADESESTNSDLLIARAFGNLGGFEKDRSNWTAAEGHLRKSVQAFDLALHAAKQNELATSVLDKGREYAETLYNLASVLESEGKLADAGRVYESALHQNDEALGNVDLTRELTRNIARVLKSQGKTEEAAQFEKQLTVAHSRDFTLWEHRSVAAVKLVEERSTQPQGDRELDELTEELQSYPKDDSNYYDGMLLVASRDLARGNIKDANAIINTSSSQLAKPYQSLHNHSGPRKAQTLLACSSAIEGNIGESVKILPPEQEHIADCQFALKRLISLCSAYKNKNALARLCKLIKAEEGDSLLLADCTKRLAALYDGSEQFTIARKLYQTAAEIEEQRLGMSDPPRLSETYFALSKACRQSFDEAAATRFYEKAVAISKYPTPARK